MELRENILLSDFTTMKIGGLARYFVEVDSLAALKDALAFARKKNLPIAFLGGGSNMLISDQGYAGIVLRILIPGIEWKETADGYEATVGAGVNWDKFVAEAVRRGYQGAENLSSIPGTTGGAIVQNIGAYGIEVKELVLAVNAYDVTTEEVKTLTRAECCFGYRESIFKRPEGKCLLVTSVKFHFKKDGQVDISYKDLKQFFESVPSLEPRVSSVRDAVCMIRKRKFPDLSLYGTAGSYFKNPVVGNDDAAHFLAKYPHAPHHPGENGHTKLSAAWIIDNAIHSRGTRDGRVGTWDAQALVVVNYGGASAKEILSFTKKIQENVFSETGVTLSPEVEFMGEQDK